MNLPKARSRQIVVQTLGKETLIYDLDAHRAFNLNETLSVVFDHCDGLTTFQDLKRKYKFTDDLINFALDELQAHNLLEGDRDAHFANLSRREAVRRVGLASMVALPVIAGLVAPRAAYAASGCAGGCNLPNATATCVNGSCQVTACNSGFGNCNNIAADGCETNLNTSTANCGNCGNACNLPNATPACIAGTCRIGACNSGFADCNGLGADGCETNLNTSSSNCGGCGNVCATGRTCVGGSCV